VIRKAKHNGSDPEDVVIDGLDNVEGIVVDSTGRKVDSCQSGKNVFKKNQIPQIYWTDGVRNSIEVAELDGTNRKVLIWANVDSPRAITLHYHKGIMFWSSWGKNPCIESAYMDGSNR
jgi:low-density lipoprotein receptor-related protein 4